MKYCDESVCLSVCLFVCLKYYKNVCAEFSVPISPIRPWLRPHAILGISGGVAIWRVMYFRFCG